MENWDFLFNWIFLRARGLPIIRQDHGGIRPQRIEFSMLPKLVELHFALVGFKDGV